MMTMEEIAQINDSDDWYADSTICWACDGEGFIVECPDDICQGLGYCMHGDDEAPCPECHGEGRLWHLQTPCLAPKENGK